MAHFAKLAEDNTVLSVLTVNDKDCQNAEGVETESIGQAYLEKHNSWPANLWVQTSYNTRNNKHGSGDDSKAFRGNYAGIGFEWDTENQIFWNPKPFPSWIKNTTTAEYESPLGAKPELTEEQKAQSKSGETELTQVSEENRGDTDNPTHSWYYEWNEGTGVWDLKDKMA